MPYCRESPDPVWGNPSMAGLHRSWINSRFEAKAMTKATFKPAGAAEPRWGDMLAKAVSDARLSGCSTR